MEEKSSNLIALHEMEANESYESLARSQFLEKLVIDAEGDAIRARTRAVAARRNLEIIIDRPDREECALAVVHIHRMAGIPDAALAALSLVAGSGPKAALAHANELQLAAMPSEALSDLLSFYQSVAEDPTAEDKRSPSQRRTQKAQAIDLILQVLAGNFGENQRMFISSLLNAIHAVQECAAIPAKRKANEVHRATGLNGRALVTSDVERIDSGLMQIFMEEVERELHVDQAFAEHTKSSSLSLRKAVELNRKILGSQALDRTDDELIRAVRKWLAAASK